MAYITPTIQTGFTHSLGCLILIVPPELGVLSLGSRPHIACETVQLSHLFSLSLSLSLSLSAFVRMCQTHTPLYSIPIAQTSHSGFSFSFLFCFCCSAFCLSQLSPKVTPTVKSARNNWQSQLNVCLLKRKEQNYTTTTTTTTTTLLLHL